MRVDHEIDLEALELVLADEGEGEVAARHADADGLGGGGKREGGYEAYMKSAEFADALGALEEVAERSTAAFMCSELKWRECHRSFISDAWFSRQGRSRMTLLRR